MELEEYLTLLDQYAYLLKERSKLWLRYIRCLKTIEFCNGKHRRLRHWAEDESAKTLGEIRRTMQEESDLTDTIDLANKDILGEEYEN